MRNIRIGDEFVLDYFNTRQGKKVNRGTFGDKLTLEDICQKPDVEQVSKVKSAPMIDKTLLQLIELGYNKTHIELLTGKVRVIEGKRYPITQVIELLRLVEPKKIKNLYPSCTRVWYSKEVKGVKDVTYSRYWCFSVSR